PARRSPQPRRESAAAGGPRAAAVGVGLARGLRSGEGVVRTEEGGARPRPIRAPPCSDPRSADSPAVAVGASKSGSLRRSSKIRLQGRDGWRVKLERSKETRRSYYLSCMGCRRGPKNPLSFAPG